MSVDVGTGGRVLPEHAAWVEPSGTPTQTSSGEGAVDRVVLFATIGLYLAGVALTCWFLFLT
jgi:hypothetical protein